MSHSNLNKDRTVELRHAWAFVKTGYLYGLLGCRCLHESAADEYNPVAPLLSGFE